MRLIERSFHLVAAALLAAGTSGTALAQSSNVAQVPLFLTQSVEPLVMLNMSNDHELYFKAYDDFSDIDGDGIPDRTYKHDFDYYGYFDPYKCYKYTSNNRFEPAQETTDKYCGAGSGLWSGNFMNWATMTRIDVVRRVLYGGLRSTDSISETVLERSFLPADAHSFAKFYDGADLNQLTPFSSATGITMCNTTAVPTTQTNPHRPPNNTFSQNVTEPPVFRVVAGDHSLWGANERWQCQWRGESWNWSAGTNLGKNRNDPAVTGMAAAPDSPEVSASLGPGDMIGINSAWDRGFRVRVQACVPGLIGTENCKYYPEGTIPKPIGLLQRYGDEDLIQFGLMTGSYSRNKRGGQLRKRIGSITNEIRPDGRFFANPAGGGIIRTLNLLRIHGYNFGRASSGANSGEAGVYNHNVAGGGDCPWAMTSFNDGRCSNWGNPQAEILLESLRYYAGLGEPTATFLGNDGDYISGLTSATWDDPIPQNKWCAPLNIIQFNASSISYDADHLSGATALGINVNQMTNEVGDLEGIHGNQFFVGESGADTNQLCTPKTVDSLSSVRGICPDAPRLEGSYQMAGMAYWANTNDIRADRQGEQTVQFTGVSLSPSRAGVTVPVPGTGGRSITILPACRFYQGDPATAVQSNCALVDFKIIEQDIDSGKGRLYINWEDSEQGGDFDQDLWGILDYSISATTVSVTTNVIFHSVGADFRLGFGYIISGTTRDGFHAHSGINGFTYGTGGVHPSYPDVPSCNDCQSGAPNTNVYTLGTSTASLLEPPLWYAAKWGSFTVEEGEMVWDSIEPGIPDNYHEATNPAQLETALDSAFLGAIRTRAAAASVATNSTRLDVDTVVYQARFDSEDWRGELLAFQIEPDGSIGDLKWDAADHIPPHGSRNIFTGWHDGTSFHGSMFQWNDLTTDQQKYLSYNSAGIFDDLGEERLQWLRGDTSNERRFGGDFRNRPVTVMGDVVNSDPYYVGTPDFGYNVLPGVEGTSYTAFRNHPDYLGRQRMLYFGANDGMLHAINADTGQERFTYIPNALYEHLSALTSPDYDHRYYVDGSPRVGDAYIGGQWRTVLIGGLGAGGRSIFALDVTRPDSFGLGNVMWELTHPELGVAIAQPTIARLPDGNWYAIMGNGPESDSGRAQLFLVNLETRQVRLLDTGHGSLGNPNGLMTPIPIDLNGDRITDTIYAADLDGNMWKFDVGSNNPANWDIAFIEAGIRHPLFTARDASNNRQPITSRPAVGSHPDGGVMVYFGTGKFFEVGDNIIVTNPPVQTFYGIRDNGVRITGNRATALQQQTIIFEGSVPEFNSPDQELDLRVVSDNEVNWNERNGWFIDLLSPVHGQEGERSVANPLLRAGRIIFTTLIPSSEPCDFGGSGWLMELDAVSGARLAYSVFDLDADGLFNEGDYVEIEIDGETVRVPVSGQRSQVGIIKTPGIISAGDREYKYTSGSTGEIGVTAERGSTLGGRQSWRQLR